MKCKYRNCSKEVIGQRNKIYCSKCCAVKDRIIRLRAEYKKRSVELMGGKCSRCGYCKCLRALQFHHLDPKQKSFGVGACGHTRSWARVQEELSKCILLCANCHAEEEDFQFHSGPTVGRGTVNAEGLGSNPRDGANFYGVVVQ